MSTVALRPLRSADFEPLCAAYGITRRPTRHLWRLRIQRSGRLVEGRLDLAIVEDDRLVGSIEARQPNGALPKGAFEIGITLFTEADRGRGIGSRAVALITEQLFTQHEAVRVQASTWVENWPMRGALEKLGWQFEGVMRGFWPLGDGSRQDFALYAILLGEAAQTSR